MTQIVDTTDPENPVVRSDLQVPADSDGSHVERNVIIVDGFLEGERQSIIRFILDPRFRERVDAGLEELIARGIGVVFDPTQTLSRDNSNAIRLFLGGSDSPRASIIMRQDVNREEQVPKIIDLEFRELI